MEARSIPVVWSPWRLTLHLPFSLHFHLSRGSIVGAVGGVLGAIDSATVGVFIAGVFTLVNTALTAWLAGRRDERKERKHRRRRSDEEDEG